MATENMKYHCEIYCLHLFSKLSNQCSNIAYSIYTIDLRSPYTAHANIPIHPKIKISTIRFKKKND